MSYHLDDTIAAIASAPGGAARGILRLTGPQTVTLLARCFTSAEPVPWTSWRQARAVDGWLQLPSPLQRVECLLYVWPDQRSYTRQPSAELHVIGSPPVLQAALRAVCTAGARLAEPGEFTLRAFLAGRLDLTQAEAVLGVIDARNHGELVAALSQLAGGLAVPLQNVRESLLDLLAHLEAGLDFVEEDLEFITRDDLQARLSQAAREVARIRAQLRSRAERDVLPRVVLAGKPNAGKSSLLNALSDEPAAIVSAQPGTTRDYVVCHVNADGLNIALVDTAGCTAAGHTTSNVDRAAQQALEEQLAQADLVLLCIDATDPVPETRIDKLSADSRASQIVVWTKCDLLPLPAMDLPGIVTSSRTGAGLPDLRRAVREQLETVAHEHSRAVVGTAVRCHESLQQAAAALRRARRLVRQDQGEELVAAEVRAALDGLGQVVGAVYTDDVLDRVFSRFCIGK
jgi:tRNA modification GTPase